MCIRDRSPTVPCRPLHRQRDRYRRLGLDIAVSTLADQVKWCTDLLQPVWRALLAEIIDARVMHLDGTGLPVQNSAAASGSARCGATSGERGRGHGGVRLRLSLIHISEPTRLLSI